MLRFEGQGRRTEVNPIQLVVRRVLSIPYIRKQDIEWYTVHLAPLQGRVVLVNMSEGKLRSAVLFRHEAKRQHPGVPLVYIQNDEVLRNYLDRARLRTFMSSDGGASWREVS